MSARVSLVLVSLMLMGLKLFASPSGVVVTASTDAREVYVHAQLILTIEIKTELPLRNGSLSKPEITNAIVEPLADNDQKTSEEQGVKTASYIRSYAIFPSEPGTITIPSIVFEGTVAQGGHGFDLFGRGQRLSASTKPMQITVKPIPSAFPKDQPFLPVKSLTVIETFDDDHQKLKVNKALTRRFEIRALGSLPSFLPIIKAPSLPGVQSYSEAGTKSQKSTPDGLLASVNFSHVYLPARPGVITIPENVISWWDTDLDKLKTTPIRAFSFEVVGDAAEAVPPTPAAPDSLEETIKQPKALTQSYLWPSLAALFFLLWLITLVFVLLRLRRREEKIIDPARLGLAELAAQVQKACEQKSGQEALNTIRALRIYAEAHQEPKALIEKLGLCARLLEDALYSPNNQELAAAFSETSKLVKNLRAVQPQAPVLPKLYPL